MQPRSGLVQSADAQIFYLNTPLPIRTHRHSSCCTATVRTTATLPSRLQTSPLASVWC